MLCSRRVLLAAFLLAAAACHPDFKITRYTTNETLYRAAMAEFDARRWANAVTAFEKLTADLPARDTLLPRAHWYLARSHAAREEWVLAGTSYSRLVESFPDDSLSDDAALASARAYRRLWRKPALDPTYGESALATYNTLIGLYPNSALIPEARKEIGELEEMFARKDFITGMYYLRRRAYDSAIIYFKDALSKYPNSPAAREAQLRLVDAYKAIRYKDDAADACAALRQSYPEDAEVRATCTGVAAPAPASIDSTRATPPATGPPPS